MSTGIFNTSTAGSTPNFVATSFASAITRLMPNGTAPLFVMTSQLGEETALQTEHGYFAKTMIFPSVTMSASATSGSILLDVNSNANILPGMALLNQRTKEQVLVNSLVSTNQITVTRGVGTTAASVNSGDVWYQIASAFEESSLRPNALTLNPVKISNLTQIFRNTWAVSGSAAATKVIAGDTNVAENRADCAKFHAMDIERALLFSRKTQGVRNGQPFRMMDGLYPITANLSYYPPSYSAANIYTAGSTTNFTQLETFFDPCFNQVTDSASPNTRVLFVGSAARKVINNIAYLKGAYQLTNGETSFGMQFTQFKIARGTFNMIEHPLFNSNVDWAKMAVAVDLAGARLAYLGGRKTQKKEFNAEGDPCSVDNGIDAMGGTLTTEVTLVVKNPPANAFVDGLTAAAAG